MQARFENIREPMSGFKDIYGHEARVKNYLSSKLSAIFQEWGYNQIIIPIVERASSFSEEVVGGSPWPEWDKRGVFYLQLQDYINNYDDLPEFSPAVLIPEGTISVSRWLGKILSDNSTDSINSLPKKIFYVTPCFRNELISKLSDTKGRQFNQVGIEILGASSILSDIEVLLLIYSGFRSIGIKQENILIRLGSVKLFNAICEESNIDDQTRIILKDKLDTIAEARAGKGPERLEPEITALLGIISKYNLPETLTKKWQQLCNTNASQLDTNVCNCFGFSNHTDEINQIAQVCQAFNIECVIDTSVVRSHEYYTGVVFEVDLLIGSHIMVEAAGGGRFNKLVSNFLEGGTLEIPSVGFAYGLERIYEAFMLVTDFSHPTKLDVPFWIDKRNADVVLYSKNLSIDSILNLFNLAEKHRTQGKRVDIYIGSTDIQESIQKYANLLSAELLSSDY